jgi:hypothetical protein
VPRDYLSGNVSVATPGRKRSVRNRAIRMPAALARMISSAIFHFGERHRTNRRNPQVGGLHHRYQRIAT